MSIQQQSSQFHGQPDSVADYPGFRMSLAWKPTVLWSAPVCGP
jgi:hypothetical protein